MFGYICLYFVNSCQYLSMPIAIPPPPNRECIYICIYMYWCYAYEHIVRGRERYRYSIFYTQYGNEPIWDSPHPSPHTMPPPRPHVAALAWAGVGWTPYGYFSKIDIGCWFSLRYICTFVYNIYIYIWKVLFVVLFTYQYTLSNYGCCYWGEIYYLNSHIFSLGKARRSHLCSSGTSWASPCKIVLRN